MNKVHSNDFWDGYLNATKEDSHHLSITISPSNISKEDSPNMEKNLISHTGEGILEKKFFPMKQIKLNLTPSNLSQSFCSSFNSSLPRTSKVVFDDECRKVIRRSSRHNWNKVRQSIESKKRFSIENSKRKSCMVRTRIIQQQVISEMKKDQLKGVYIHPNNSILVIWKFLFQIGLIYYSLTYSYRMAFGIRLFQLDLINIIEEITEVDFLLNTILNFFIAIQLPDGSINKSKKAIAANYLRGTLILDIIALIPWDLISESIAGLKLLRIIHLVDSFTYIKSTTALIIPYFVDGIQALIISSLVGGIVTMLLFLAFAFHLTTVVWIVLGSPRSEGEKTWFANVHNEDGNDGDLYHGSMAVYMDGLFFIAQSILPVGYGSLTYYTIREYLFTMATLLFGMFIFAFFFEKTKSSLISYNSGQITQKKKNEELRTWLMLLERSFIENSIVFNGDLLDEIKTTLHHKINYSWQELFRDNNQFKYLDPNIRTYVKILNKSTKPLKKRFQILFKYLSDGFFEQLMLQSESLIYLPNEIIIKRGTCAKGLFLILKGSVLAAGKSIDDPFQKLIPGSFFGETSLLPDKNISLSYIARDEVHCLMIRQEAFLSLSNRYSEDLDKLRVLAYYRHNYLLAEKEKHESGSEIKFNGICLDRVPSIYPHDKAVSVEKNISLKDEKYFDFQMKLSRLVEEFSDTSSPFKMNKAFSFVEENNQSLNAINTYSLNDSRLVLLPQGPRHEIGSLNKFERGNTIKIIENHPKTLSKLFPHSIEEINQPLISLQKILIFDDSDIEGSDISDSDTESKGESLNEEEREDNEDDELNQSAFFPLEIITPDFSDISEVNEIKCYLEERTYFLQSKLEKLKKTLQKEVQYIARKMKIFNKKFMHKDTHSKYYYQED